MSKIKWKKWENDKNDQIIKWEKLKNKENKKNKKNKKNKNNKKKESKKKHHVCMIYSTRSSRWFANNNRWAREWIKSTLKFTEMKKIRVDKRTVKIVWYFRSK